MVWWKACTLESDCLGWILPVFFATFVALDNFCDLTVFHQKGDDNVCFIRLYWGSNKIVICKAFGTLLGTQINIPILEDQILALIDIIPHFWFYDVIAAWVADSGLERAPRFFCISWILFHSIQCLLIRVRSLIFMRFSESLNSQVTHVGFPYMKTSSKEW